jgi:hypothetical protein
LSEYLEVGTLADIQTDCSHLVESARGEERVVFEVRVDGLRFHQLRRLFPRE